MVSKPHTLNKHLCMFLKGRKERKNTEWPIINFNCCPLISRRRHVNRLCKLIKRVIQSTYCFKFATQKTREEVIKQKPYLPFPENVPTLNCLFFFWLHTASVYEHFFLWCIFFSFQLLLLCNCFTLTLINNSSRYEARNKRR